MKNAWIDRPEDVLVLRALRHVEHVVELAVGARIEARIRALVDEDWHGRRRYAKSRIGEIFAHELLLGDTGEPFESIEYAFREHGEAVRGDDDEQPWNATPPLFGAENRTPPPDPDTTPRYRSDSTPRASPPRDVPREPAIATRPVRIADPRDPPRLAAALGRGASDRVRTSSALLI